MTVFLIGLPLCPFYYVQRIETLCLLRFLNVILLLYLYTLFDQKIGYKLWEQILIVRSRFLLANLYHFVLYNYIGLIQVQWTTISKIQRATCACYRFFWDWVIIPIQALRHFCKSHFSVQKFKTPNFLALRANIYLDTFLLYYHTQVKVSNILMVNIYTIPFVIYNCGGQQFPKFSALCAHFLLFLL